jgi:hypothetical protein
MFVYDILDRLYQLSNNNGRRCLKKSQSELIMGCELAVGLAVTNNARLSKIITKSILIRNIFRRIPNYLFVLNFSF